jgi:two-component system cell cycle sensor histidine kinase/response regulator CckA
MDTHDAFKIALLERGKLVTRVLVDFSPDIIYQLNEKGEIEFVSQAVKSLGWEPTELLGKSICDLIEPSCAETPAPMPRLTERRVGDRATRNLRIRLKERDGNACDYDITDMMFALSARGLWDVPDNEIKDPKKRFLGTLGIARNVSSQAKAERALREAYDSVQRQIHDKTAELLAANADLRSSQHKLKVLFDSAADLIFIHTLKGRLLEANLTASDRLGYSHDELLGMSQVDIDAEYRSDLSERRTDELLTNRNTIFETTYITKGGHPIPVECNSRLFEYDGKRAVLTVARDISKRKAVEEERHELERTLLHAQKMDAVGETAGCVAHDINNRLTVISGYVEMLRETPNLDPDFLRDLNEIAKAAEGAVALNRQLLMFARKDEGSPEVKDVAELIMSLETFMRGLLPENIRLELPTDAKGSCANVDAGQLEQVMINLVVNARDAIAQAQGKITIGVDRVQAKQTLGSAISGETVRISVTDNGPGVPPRLQQRIFEPFYTTKPAGKGTGLGLSVVYGIVRRHGGSVDVVNNPSGGATFHIQLPYHPEQQRTADKTEKVVARASKQGGRVLIVEDEPFLLQLSSRAFESKGYCVLTAETGSDALAELENNDQEPDLIFMDVVLPDIETDQMISRVRKLTPKVPILFTSGYSPDESETVHRIVAEEHFIAKPFDVNALLLLANELVGEDLAEGVAASQQE